MNSIERFLSSLVCIIMLCTAGGVLSAEKSKAETRQNPAIDELFPIYECDDRSREWTKRCLVPLTNAQLSLDLCGTGKKPDLAGVKSCAKELQILALSCPQRGPVSELAKDMLSNNPLPPPSHESPNTPKVSKPSQRPAGGGIKDRWSL